LASRMSCPTFRIFSANGSRASFCRIPRFIILAASTYTVAEYAGMPAVRPFSAGMKKMSAS
jgi:hypothetical protein